MEEANNKISGLQLGIITFFLSGSVFVGLGTISILLLSDRDAWITNMVATLVCIIPTILLLYIINYRPDKNIFEKNNILFGKWIGFIVNLVLSAYVLFIVLLVAWSTTNFAITMYLVKTPAYFIIGIFVLAAVYAVIKGIETIGRVCEVIFFLNIILLFIIIVSLSFQFHFDYLKPILKDGITPIIMDSFVFTSYLFAPLIMISVVPKNDVVNNKQFKRYIIGGIFCGLLLMFAVFTLVPGVITPELASLYRFPAYYIHRKISIAGVINNLENFVSLHWYFNTFILIVMGMYFLNKYIKHLFNIQKTKTTNIVAIAIGLIVIICNQFLFNDAVESLEFMKKIFPLYVTGPLLILATIMTILIFIRKRKKA